VGGVEGQVCIAGERLDEHLRDLCKSLHLGLEPDVLVRVAFKNGGRRDVLLHDSVDHQYSGDLFHP
jgi:hypothetical protein